MKTQGSVEIAVLNPKIYWADQQTANLGRISMLPF